MPWLITGGAGYIGGHVVQTFLHSGIEFIILDDFSTGSRNRIPQNAVVIEGSVTDKDLIFEVFQRYEIEGVVHLAAKKNVGESFQIPIEYNLVNVTGTKNILDACIKFNVRNIIFSSTAAVYYPSDTGALLHENSLVRPISPYGLSKIKAEHTLIEYSEKYGMKLIIFRFFNVTGATNSYLAETNGTNLLTAIRKSILNNEPLEVFGRDFPTPDGTCIRDYVHVKDICEAHVIAVKLLRSKKIEYHNVFNLGRGMGYSVLQVIHEIELQLNFSIKWKFVYRRKNDAPIAVCDASRIKTDWGWTASTYPFENINYSVK